MEPGGTRSPLQERTESKSTPRHNSGDEPTCYPSRHSETRHGRRADGRERRRGDSEDDQREYKRRRGLDTESALESYVLNDADIKTEVKQEGPPKKDFVDLKPSGLLGAETNTKNGVLLKFTLPLDARKPTKGWKLFVFKNGDEDGKTISLNRMRSYLIGKDVRVVDIPMMHPTVSKQHAVIVHRLVKDAVRPYIMDLESTNGTFLNDERIEASRYYELIPKDLLKFAKSSREYVILPDDLVDVEEVDLKEIVSSKLKEEDEQAKRRTRNYW